MKRRILLLATAIAVATCHLSAAIPSGYYNSAEGKNQKELLTALYNIVSSHTKVSYDGLWDAYKTTDNNGGYYWDMYATTKFPLGTKHCGNYSSVGDCVNREHSFPKSWWGGSKANQYSDLFHLYPTDGYVNNQRSNYPFGECANGKYLATNGTNKPLGKLGASTFSGYTGTVFEPDDEYKGDFARTYFGLAASYNNVIKSWTSGNGSAMMAGNNYPVFNDWAIELLLKWHRLDPVSEKETNRNDAMYSKQGNRNPFIDHPEMVEYIWGNKKDQKWSSTATATPSLVTPTAGNPVDFGTVARNTTSTQAVEVKGVNLTQNLTVSVTGTGFSCATSTLTATAVNNGTTLNVAFSSPATAQQSTGTLTLSSSEVSVTVTLKAQTITGIPALPATEVTTSSFQANWTSMGDATTYELRLFEDDGATAVKGFPVNVNAASGTYLVTGLNPSTTYYYQLASATLTSNAVEVTTLDPTRVISIQTSGDFIIDAARGKASPVLEAQVYTEYVEEDVDLTVTGNFELSLNKLQWAQQLTIDPDGETFYIRLKSTATEGTFEGLLSASTATLDGADVEVTGYVTDPDAQPNVTIEDFEAITSGGYWTNTAKQGTFSWTFNNAGVWGQPNDHYNGSQAVRMLYKAADGNSSITMAQDKSGGASNISFKASLFGSDADALLTVSYSTNGGTTWTKLQDITLSASAAAAPRADGPARLSFNSGNEYNIPMDVKGDIRFKFEQSSGKRINIDDIAITDARISTAVIDNVNAPERTWEAVPVFNGVLVTTTAATTVEVYNVEAQRVAKRNVKGSSLIALPAGIYIVTAGNHALKLIVK